MSNSTITPTQLHSSMLRTMQIENERVSRAYTKLNEGSAQPKIIPIYRRLDELVAKAPLPIDCQSGCDFCCHYHVYVTPLEIFAILEEVEKLPFSQRMSIDNALSVYVLKIKGMTPTQHIQTNIACAFLKDKQCSIYDVRPLACRRHHSADVQVCERTFVDVTSDENCPQDPVRVVASAAMENLHKVKHIKSGLDVSLYEFHSAMLEAMTNKACLKRWRAGKIAFPSVVDIVAAQVE